MVVITQYIIGFVKPLSLELQKSSCNLVQAQAEANRTKIVISKQSTEAVYSGLYQRSVGIAETVNVTSEKPRSAPLVARSIPQMLMLIWQRHISEGMCFTHLMITSLAKWSDVSQMK